MVEIVVGVVSWLAIGFIAWMMAVNQLHGVLNREDKSSSPPRLDVPRRYKMIVWGPISLVLVVVTITRYPKQYRHWGLRVSIF